MSEGSRASCSAPAKSRLGDKDKKEDCAYDAWSRRNGRSAQKSAGHPRRPPIMSASASESRAANGEGEVSLRLVRIDREHVPMHPVGSRCKRLSADVHGAAADLRLAVIDASALAICHLHGAERRLEILRERSVTLARRASAPCRRPAGWHDRARRVRARRHFPMRASRSDTRR